MIWVVASGPGRNLLLIAVALAAFTVGTAYLLRRSDANEANLRALCEQNQRVNEMIRAMRADPSVKNIAATHAAEQRRAELFHIAWPMTGPCGA
jgi:uncharacterized protein HemX